MCSRHVLGRLGRHRYIPNDSLDKSHYVNHLEPPRVLFTSKLQEACPVQECTDVLLWYIGPFSGENDVTGGDCDSDRLH